jgi:Galactose oxidase, central domain
MQSTWLGLAVLLLADCGAAQVQWSQRPVLSGQGCPTAYDLARGQAVAFTGLAETYVSTPAGWTRLQPATSPSRRCGHALAYDASRQRVVLFGGHNEYPPYQDHDDTWEWDGTDWLQRTPANRPSVRWGHAMVYDPANGRCVLFGGSSATNFDDTWEWNGTDWTQRSTAVRPSPRYFHGMAYDAPRQVTVLFGGTDAATGVFGDTWEWNGTAWAQRAPAVSPPVRFAHGMTFDPARNRTVVFGGDPSLTGSPCRDDTWEWDGSNWSQRQIAVVPPARYRPGFTFDPNQGRVVMFSGNSGSPDFAGLTDSWALDGAGWSQLAAHRVPVRGALAYDSVRQRTICYGGYTSAVTPQSATWEWDGTAWTERQPAVSPPARVRSAIAFDGLRGRLVMFGGATGFGALPNDTWEWDGVNWSLRTPAASPPGRDNHAMVFDAARGRVVLFGGVGASGPVFDTWEWDGVTWTPFTTPVRPNAIGACGMAFDSARQRTVLFGGLNALGAPLDETWEWNGTAWLQRTPANRPSPRFYPQLAYDSARARTVLFGISDFAQELLDTWEWDGSNWLLRTPADMPRPLLGSGITFDSDREVIVLFANQTWEYGPLAPASVVGAGPGCAGTLGVPVLQPVGASRPWTGDAFEVAVSNVPQPPLGLMVLGLGSAATDLTGLGMPGCVSWTSADVVQGVTAGGGHALPIPAQTSLLGVQIRQQAAVFDAAANSFGFVLSNALLATIGAR